MARIYSRFADLAPLASSEGPWRGPLLMASKMVVYSEIEVDSRAIKGQTNVTNV